MAKPGRTHLHRPVVRESWTSGGSTAESRSPFTRTLEAPTPSGRPSSGRSGGSGDQPSRCCLSSPPYYWPDKDCARLAELQWTLVSGLHACQAIKLCVWPPLIASFSGACCCAAERCELWERGRLLEPL